MTPNDVARLIAEEEAKAEAEVADLGPRIDYGTDTWRNLETYLNQQIALRRTELEDPRSGPELTNYYRGQIAGYREIIELGVKQKLLDSGDRNFKFSN